MEIRLGTIKGEINPKRLSFIDNLRVILMVLVIVQHSALTYFSKGSWYYYEQGDHKIADIILSCITNVNQVCLAGLFFMLAGYLIPSSFERKGIEEYLTSRFLRLGIPLLIYSFILTPVLDYIKKRIVFGEKVSFFHFYFDGVLLFKHVNPGPLLFAAILLIFCLSYVILNLSGYLNPYSFSNVSRLLTNKTLFNFTLILSVATFIFRFWFRLKAEMPDLQQAFIPQYAGLFIAGIYAFRNRWLRVIPASVGRLWIIITSVDILIVEVILRNTGFFKEFSSFSGGLHWNSLFMSFHQALLSIGMCISLLYIFRYRFNKQSNLFKDLAGNAYTVYLINAPFVIFLASGFRHNNMPVLLKFATLSIISSVMCFFMAHFVIREIPHSEKIL